jgi:hypothetical protein
VDKRTVYGYWGKTMGGLDVFECGLTEHCGHLGEDMCPSSRKCEKRILVDPAALAKLESDAARVTELEGVIAKKDEALKAARMFAKAWCEKHRDEGGECLDECPVTSILGAIDIALFLTPESVAKEAEYACIGRAVVEWVEVARTQLPERNAPEDRGYWAGTYDGRVNMLDELQKVITKTKGGEGK